jgi:hypothetical protein
MTTKEENGEKVYINWKIVDDLEFPPIVISPSETYEYNENGQRVEYLQVIINRAYSAWLGYQKGTIGGVIASPMGAMPPLIEKINEVLNGYLREQHTIMMMDREGDELGV